MNLEEAKTILAGCVRWDLVDHAFGDKEVSWAKDDTKIASGYFGGGTAMVQLFEGNKTTGFFKDEEARELAECGAEVHAERNDETGPDEFVEGEVMPGLSLGDVFHELTGSYLDGS